MSNLQSYISDKIGFLTEDNYGTNTRLLRGINQENINSSQSINARSLYLDSMYFSDFKSASDAIEQERLYFQSSYCNSVLSNQLRQVQLDSSSYNLIFQSFQLQWQTVASSTQVKVSNQDLNSNVSFVVSDISSNTTLNIQQLAQQLYRQSVLLNGTSKICIISSTLRTDPLDGQSFVNQTYALLDQQRIKKLEIIDSVGNSLLAGTNGSSLSVQNGDSSTPLMLMEFQYNFDESENKYLNQTVCMNIDGSQDANYASTKWNDKDCTTDYLPSQNLIRCSCSSLGNNFYTVIRDSSRAIQIGPTVQVQTSGKGAFSFYMVILLAFLFLLLLCLLIPATVLDRRDYTRLRNNFYKVDPFLLMKVGKRRYKPVSMIEYRSAALQLYLKKIGHPHDAIKKPSCCLALSLLCRQQHPLVSLFAHFESNLPRVRRAALTIVQVNCLAITALVFFKFMSYQHHFDQDSLTDDTITLENALIAVYVGIVCSLLLLPVPTAIQFLFSSRFEIDLTPPALQKRYALEDLLASKLSSKNQDSHNQNPDKVEEEKSDIMKEGGEQTESEESLTEKRRTGASRFKKQKQRYSDKYEEDEYEETKSHRRRADEERGSEEAKDEALNLQTMRAANFDTSRRMLSNQKSREESLRQERYGPVELNEIELETETDKEADQECSQHQLQQIFSQDQIQIERSRQQIHNSREQNIIQDQDLQNIAARALARSQKTYSFNYQDHYGYDIYSQVKNDDSEFGALKCLLVPFAIGLTLGVIVAFIVVSITLPLSYQLQILIAFAIALAVSWLVLTPLKLMLVSCLLNFTVLWMKKMSSRKRKPCCLRSIQWCFVNKESVEMMKDLMAVIDYANTPLEDDSLRESKARFVTRKQKERKPAVAVHDNVNLVRELKTQNDKSNRNKEEKDQKSRTPIQKYESVKQVLDSPKRRQRDVGAHNQKLGTFDQTNHQTPLRGTQITSAFQSTQSKNLQSQFLKTNFNPQNSVVSSMHITFQNNPQNSQSQNLSSEQNEEPNSQMNEQKHFRVNQHPAQGKKLLFGNFVREQIQDLEDESLDTFEEQDNQIDEEAQRVVQPAQRGIQRNNECIQNDEEDDDEIGDGLSERLDSNDRIINPRNQIEDDKEDDSFERDQAQIVNQQQQQESQMSQNSSIISKVPMEQRNKRINSDTLQLQLNPSVDDKLRNANHSAISFSKLSEILESPHQLYSNRSRPKDSSNNLIARYLQDQAQSSLNKTPPSMSASEEARKLRKIREPEEEDSIDKTQRREKIQQQQQQQEEKNKEFEWELESYRDEEADSQDQYEAHTSSDEDQAFDEVQRYTPEAPELSPYQKQFIQNPWKQSINSQNTNSIAKRVPAIHNYMAQNRAQAQSRGQQLSDQVYVLNSVNLSHQNQYEANTYNRSQDSDDLSPVQKLRTQQIENRNFENEQSIQESVADDAQESFD